MRTVAGMLSTIVIVAACAQPADPDATEESAFLAPDFGEVAPLTDDEFDTGGNKFTFAVHSDLTGGERDGIYEVAIAQLNLLRPEFIINVGDLIEGGTDESIVDEQWDWFDERAGRAKAPVFYVAGNHDRTGALMQSIWDRRQGRAYYHFRYKDVLFLVLDTEDNTPERVEEINAMRQEALKLMATGGMEAAMQTEYGRLPERQAGNITEAQSQYMIDAIRANPDVRWTFLFMHKSPWLREEQKTFPAIEEALADRPYTVFHGHFHSYAYQQRNGNDYIRLATTGGSQNDQGARSVDHVTLVTVDDDGVDIANLLMEGILDKTGHVPLNGEELCFESTRCGEAE
jgi:predicted phosphodiesterase